MECVVYGKSCRSVNYNKASDFGKNCEFLQDVSWEKPDLLLKNESYDHYLLLNCPNTERVSTCVAQKKNFFEFLEISVTTVFSSKILGPVQGVSKKASQLRSSQAGMKVSIHARIATEDTLLRAERMNKKNSGYPRSRDR